MGSWGIMVKVDFGRVRVVGGALSLVGWEGFVRLDMLEPEYVVLSDVYRETGDVRPLLLLGVSAAIIDYQLAGDAYRFWGTLHRVVRERGYRLSSPQDVRRVMEEFLSRPVNARLNKAKRLRVARFYESGFADYLWSTAYRYYSTRPVEVWHRLARALNNPPHRKTIVFAVKVLDLISLIAEGRYSQLPHTIPIPLDIHVARMAIYSGIVAGATLRDAEKACQLRTTVFHEAWGQVARTVSERLGRRITTLRIDSLIWQLGNKTAKIRDKHQAQQVITAYLAGKAGISPAAAQRIAETLTYNYH